MLRDYSLCRARIKSATLGGGLLRKGSGCHVTLESAIRRLVLCGHPWRRYGHRTKKRNLRLVRNSKMLSLELAA